MGTTSTPNLNLIKPNPFEEEDTWAQILNSNFDKIDTSVAAKQTRTTASNALSAVTPAADKMVYFTSGSAAATSTITPWMRSFLQNLNEGAAKFQLGLGTLADQSQVDLTWQVANTLAIANGGTGGNTASAARTALGVAAKVHTHIIDDVTGLQAALDGKQAAGSYVTSATLTSTLSTYATISYVSSTLSSYATVSYVNTQVGGVVSATKANVQNAYAGSVAYDVGTYVIGRPANATAYAVNATIAGSSLYATSAAAIYNSGWNAAAGETLINTGTWRCMSPTNDSGSNGVPGLWLRIS